MKTLAEHATILENLWAPMPANVCSQMAVNTANLPYEQQMRMVAIDIGYLRGYQAALRRHGNGDYERVIEAIDEAKVAIETFKAGLRDKL